MKKSVFTITIACAVLNVLAAKIQPGLTLYDTNGDTLHAHAGDITKVGNKWYFIGEAPRILQGTFGDFGGFNCYSTADLANWKYEGMVLPPNPNAGYLSSKSRIAYDPHVLYNSTTKKYVMVMAEYNDSTGGCVFIWATSDSINGTYTLAKVYDPKVFIGDFMAYKDDDGTGYLIYDDRHQANVIDRLSADYLSITGRVCQATPGGCDEAPCLVKIGGTYYLYNSYCSYWSPNQGHYWTATNIAGPWSTMVKNIGDATTYNSQGTTFITVQGSITTTYIYIADRWICPTGACDKRLSTYVMLPLVVGANGSLTMNWYENWYINVATGQWSATPFNTVATPSFNPPAGQYTGTQSVSINCDTSGATIHYTLDGTTPTLSSPTYAGPITVNTTTTIKARAFKTGMDASEIAVGVFQILPPGTDYTVLTTQVPALVDVAEGNNELGMKFRTSVDGIIIGVRYYRSPTETGTHTGRIWSSSGTQLASMDFGNETSSGWQQAMLSSPLSVVANTTYIVSVNDNSKLVVTHNELSTAIANGPISSVADGSNGVYGPKGTFPAQTYSGNNYYVDVVFRQVRPTSARAGRHTVVKPMKSSAVYYNLTGRLASDAAKTGGILLRVIHNGGSTAAVPVLLIQSGRKGCPTTASALYR